MEEQLEGGRLNPLLLPSVVIVLVEFLEPNQLPACRKVCKVWSDTIRNKTSPLLNQRVLSLVIEHLARKITNPLQILPYRLVCSLWNTAIINSPRWKNPKIDHYDGINWFFGRFFKCGVGTDDFERFSRKFGDPQNLPLPLAFTHFTADINVSLNDPTTQDFLNDYGSHIKSIELNRCKWTLEDLRSLLFENAVNLESLKIVCGVIPGTQVGSGRRVSVPELEVLLHEDPSDFKVLEHMRSISIDMNLLDTKDRVRPYVEQFLGELFESCSKIHTIQFDFKSWYARTWATNFLTRDTVNLSYLTVLDHLIDPDLETVQNLTKKHFPLKKLKIRIRYKNVTLQALHDLFRSLSNTLEDLQLVFMDYSCAHEFPSSKDLVRLKRLELWKFKGQLAFLKDFVNLESLFLGEIDLKGQEVFKNRDILRGAFKSVEFKDYWEVRVFS